MLDQMTVWASIPWDHFTGEKTCIKTVIKRSDHISVARAICRTQQIVKRLSFYGRQDQQDCAYNLQPFNYCFNSPFIACYWLVNLDAVTMRPISTTVNLIPFFNVYWPVSVDKLGITSIEMLTTYTPSHLHLPPIFASALGIYFCIVCPIDMPLTWLGFLIIIAVHNLTPSWPLESAM